MRSASTPGPMPDSTAIVYAPAAMAPVTLAALAVEVVRVGAGAVRLPPADAGWLMAARSAVESATGLLVLDPDDQPFELLLGPSPVAELHAALAERAADELVVGGPDVRALFAGLAAGTHLRAGSADTSLGSTADASPRHDVQLVARAAALARLAGRPPMPASELRQIWGRGS